MEEKEDTVEPSLEVKGRMQERVGSPRGLNERVEQEDPRVTVKAVERQRLERPAALPYLWVTVPIVASRDTQLDSVQRRTHLAHRGCIMANVPSAALWATRRNTAPNR